MEKVFITLYNTQKIVLSSNLSAAKFDKNLYKTELTYFNKYEENMLLAVQELLENPEKFFNTVYKKYIPQDSYKFIYKEKAPAYHTNKSCSRLNSKFENFEVPTDIQEKGSEKVQEFRDWFESVKNLYEKDKDAFAARLYVRWGILTNPKAISIENSGNEDLKNFTLADIESKIDELIKKSKEFIESDKKYTKILKTSKIEFLSSDGEELFSRPKKKIDFAKMTYLHRKEEIISPNNTGYSDAELKSVLKQFEIEYKNPLKFLLIEYYRLKLNPELKMDSTFLEKLGFHLCSECRNSSSFALVQLEKFEEIFNEDISEN